MQELSPPVDMQLKCDKDRIVPYTKFACTHNAWHAMLVQQPVQVQCIFEQLTWADLHLVGQVAALGVVGAETQIANYPKLNGLNERVKKLPKIAEWIAKRPTTPW